MATTQNPLPLPPLAALNLSSGHQSPKSWQISPRDSPRSYKWKDTPSWGHCPAQHHHSEDLGAKPPQTVRWGRAPLRWFPQGGRLGLVPAHLYRITKQGAGPWAGLQCTSRQRDHRSGFHTDIFSLSLHTRHAVSHFLAVM